jgi:TolB protein
MTFLPLQLLSNALRAFFVGLILICGASVQAQFRIEVTGVGLTQVPVTVTSFRGQDTLSQKISEIVSADLERSGQFRSVKAPAGVFDETIKPEL